MSNAPRLIQTDAGEETRKPEELEGEDITILKAVESRRPDGSTSAKWVVRRADGSRGIYWSAGQDPTLKVGVWFMEYPAIPLPCRIFRQANKYGTQVWHIEQRIEDEGSAEARQDSLDNQLAAAGMMG